MEPIAVNRVTITRELFAESHAAVFSHRHRKMLLYCGIVFLAFGLILLAVQARFPVASALCVPALLSGVIVVVWALTLEKTELKKKYRAFQRRNGDDSERVITCYHNHLTVDTGTGEPVQIDYPDIKEHKETEHLILLLCNDHTGIHLAKDGFVTGTLPTLLAAIEKAKEEAERSVGLIA
ncbi:MAG: hypothetical protein IKN05_10995 [Clostridia bacterium]|nr:hypothetical protein [Clostridia bacterium]